MEQENKTNIQAPSEDSLLAYICGKVPDVEAYRIERWLQSDIVNEKALLQIATIYYAQDRQKRITNRDSLHAFETVQRRIRSKNKKNMIFRISHLVAAACIMGVIFLSALLLYSHEPVSVHSAQVITVQANSGMRSQFMLSDGTIVHLNSGSKLSYPTTFSDEQRKVSLNGEACFKVAHNPECPFIVGVSDDQLQVKVLGTEFNLNAYENETNVITTLVSGQVDIIINRGGKTVSQNLQPSDKATYDLLAGKMNIEKVNTQYETSWTEGKLMFKNSLLPDVLKKIAFFYNVKFEVKNESINNYRLTGVFDNRQLVQVLDYLRISSGIKYRIQQTTKDDSQNTRLTVVTLY